MEDKTKFIKARLYIGGLRSLFEDMTQILAEVEKTGSMPNDMFESLADVNQAIQLTIRRLKAASVKCCVHASTIDEEEDDDEDDEETEEVCEDCESEVESKEEKQQKAIAKKIKQKAVEIADKNKKVNKKK